MLNLNLTTSEMFLSEVLCHRDYLDIPKINSLFHELGEKTCFDLCQKNNITCIAICIGIVSRINIGIRFGIGIRICMSINISIRMRKKIKMSITGKGTSSKEQVAAMILHILKVKTLPEPLDASDGLAAAVCHYFQSTSPTGGKKYSGWDSFLKNNPNKLR